MTPQEKLTQVVDDGLNMLHFKMEQQIRISIQPKRWWIPTFVWHWLIRIMLVREMGLMTVTEEKK